MRLQLSLIFGLALAATAPGQAAIAEVKIGFANPLSGPFSESGERNRIAVEMAVEDLNARGGVLGEQSRLVTADDGCGLQTCGRRGACAGRGRGARSSSGTCAPTRRCSPPASTRRRTS